MTREDAEKLADWLYRKTQEFDFAELGVTVRLHKGNAPIVERTVIEKQKLTGTTGGRHEANRIFR